MLIDDILTKQIIKCTYLDHKNYNFQTFVISFERYDRTYGQIETYTYKSNSSEFEIVEDDEYYMYVTDKYLFICKQEDKEWNKWFQYIALTIETKILIC